jgi:hypothetical protein
MATDGNKANTQALRELILSNHAMLGVVLYLYSQNIVRDIKGEKGIVVIYRDSNYLKNEFKNGIDDFLNAFNQGYTGEVKDVIYYQNNGGNIAITSNNAKEAIKRSLKWEIRKLRFVSFLGRLPGWMGGHLIKVLSLVVTLVIIPVVVYLLIQYFKK